MNSALFSANTTHANTSVNTVRSIIRAGRFDDDCGWESSLDRLTDVLRCVADSTAALVPGYGGVPPDLPDCDAAIRACGALACFVEPAERSAIRAATTAWLSFAEARFDVTPVSDSGDAGE